MFVNILKRIGIVILSLVIVIGLSIGTMFGFNKWTEGKDKYIPSMQMAKFWDGLIGMFLITIVFTIIASSSFSWKIAIPVSYGCFLLVLGYSIYNIDVSKQHYKDISDGKVDFVKVKDDE